MAAADQGTAMATATATEEGGVVAEAAVLISFGAFAALNGAVETVMLMRAAMRRIVGCRSRSEGIACTVIHNYVDSIYWYTCINRSYYGYVIVLIKLSS